MKLKSSFWAETGRRSDRDDDTDRSRASARPGASGALGGVDKGHMSGNTGRRPGTILDNPVILSGRKSAEYYKLKKINKGL